MAYIHVNDSRITAFAEAVIRDRADVRTLCEDVLAWVSHNTVYSRLNAPFFPLQRSDLDVLSMGAGTCGDFSNLLVSLLLTLGYEAQYAYVHKDCFGNEQDHICAAILQGERWVLIDATMPYRKWHGFDCPHLEYELLSPAAFEERMKREEAHWSAVAQRFGDMRYAGILYAPWLHDELLLETQERLESAFFLAAVDGKKNIAIYAYNMVYTPLGGTIPTVCRIDRDGKAFRFSCRPPQELWDDDQWGEAFPEADVPASRKTDAFRRFSGCIDAVMPRISTILSELP